MHALASNPCEAADVICFSIDFFSVVFLSDVLKELDCTELIDAQETSKTRVVS